MNLVRFLSVFFSTLLLVVVLTACENATHNDTTNIKPAAEVPAAGTFITEAATAGTEFIAEATTAGTASTTAAATTSQETIHYCEPENNMKVRRGGLNHDYVQMVCRLTGEDSLNHTFTRYGFGRNNREDYDILIGTDLGIPVYDAANDKMLFFFGDTVDVGLWASNAVAFSTDFDASDGILFDSMRTERCSHKVAPLIQGKHDPDIADGVDGKTRDDRREVTKIPTGGIAIGHTIYMHFMSIRTWNPGWQVNYNSVIKSTNGGRTWRLVPCLRWNQDDAYNFGQIFPVEDKENPEMVYIYGIPGGRSGGVKLGRVLKANYEKMDQYEYYNGLDDKGEPIWVKGRAGLQAIKDNDDAYIFQNDRFGTGEVSVMYNPYLGKWMIGYLKNGYALVYRTADNPWGNWSSEITLATNDDYYKIYGVFMHEKLMKDNGKTVYFMMSQFDLLYDAYVMEVVFR